MTKKQWRNMNEELKRVAVLSYMEGYRINKRKSPKELENYKYFYNFECSESPKKNYTDEEFQTILKCVDQVQFSGSRRAFRNLMIFVAVVIVCLILLF